PNISDTNKNLSVQANSTTETTLTSLSILDTINLIGKTYIINFEYNSIVSIEWSDSLLTIPPLLEAMISIPVGGNKILPNLSERPTLPSTLSHSTNPPTPYPSPDPPSPTYTIQPPIPYPPQCISPLSPSAISPTHNLSHFQAQQAKTMEDDPSLSTAKTKHDKGKRQNMRLSYHQNHKTKSLRTQTQISRQTIKENPRQITN
ncbi:hypothetical protein CHS0354_024868, partial [Potamilus streckersoni]